MVFTVVAIATLAVGIGANATVFTFIDNILLRSLAIHDPEQVDALNWGGLANMSSPTTLIFVIGIPCFRAWWLAGL